MEFNEGPKNETTCSPTKKEGKEKTNERETGPLVGWPRDVR